jgi:hypothetical protein
MNVGRRNVDASRRIGARLPKLAMVDLRLRRSVGGAEPAKASKAPKKPRKAASGQKEMLMTIAGKKPAKEAAASYPISIIDSATA